MAQVAEQIVVTVSGANGPKTLNYNVLVDTVTGAAVSNPLTITYTGANAGSDNIVATMASHSLTSNQADVVWQATNGNIATGPITVKYYARTDTAGGYAPPATWPASPGLTTTINSIILNQVAANTPITGTGTFPTNIGQGGAYKVQPMLGFNQTSTGASAGQVPVSLQNDPDNSHNHPGFFLDCRGNLVVNTPGTYTFYFQYANVSSYALYVGGGAVKIFDNAPNNAGVGPAFPGTAPNGLGYPLMSANSGHNSLIPGTLTLYINFPAAGTYPFMVIYNQFMSIQFSGDHNGYFQITQGSGSLSTSVGTGWGSTRQWFPVASIATAPPPGTTPTGALRLTPVGGSANLKTQGQNVSLQLSIQNVPYTTIPYVPVLEGTAGQVPLYDNNGSTFNFGGVVYPPSGGTAPDFTSALAASQTAITGDNNAWNGLFSIAPYPTGSPTALSLSYNGGAPPSHIDVSNLTITSDDIAWFDGTNKTYDLFTASSSGGGNQFPIQVAYMVRPTIPTLTTVPLTMGADGAHHTITVSLAKPMSPEQQGLFGTGNSVAATASASNGVTVTSQPAAVLDGAGWLTGWSLVVLVPHSTTNGSFQLSMNVTGVLTYLNGTVFVNSGAITYFNGVVATISTTGVIYNNPTNYSFVVTAATGGTLTGTGSSRTFTGKLTFTAVVFATDNGPITASFFRILGSTKTVLTPAATASSPVAVSGGYHTTLTATITTSYTWGTPLKFGYDATDTLSTLTVSYTDTISYVNGNTNPIGSTTCFSGNVGVQTPDGYVLFESLPEDEAFLIRNKTGDHKAVLLVHEYEGTMIDMGTGVDELVTPEHLMEIGEEEWLAATYKFRIIPAWTTRARSTTCMS